MALAEPFNRLSKAIEQYTAIPNRDNWLVLRKHSRARVRALLAELPEMADQTIAGQIWEVALARFEVAIPEDQRIGRSLKHITDQPLISPEALDAYLSAHPDALTGNAEADLCPKHSAWIDDIPSLRKTLERLLDGSVDVTRRIDDVLDGAFRLPGFGPATATTLLMCWNDGKPEADGPTYSKWTGHTERALQLFGIPFEGNSPGERYAAIWEQQKRLLRAYPFRDLSDVDLFMLFADPRGLGMVTT